MKSQSSPKAGALPTALHPDRNCFRDGCIGQSAFNDLLYVCDDDPISLPMNYSKDF